MEFDDPDDLAYDDEVVVLNSKSLEDANAIDCVEMPVDDARQPRDPDDNTCAPSQTPIFSCMEERSPMRIVCSIIENNYNIPSAEDRLDANFQMLILTTLHALSAQAKDHEPLIDDVRKSLNQPPDIAQLENFVARLHRLQSIQRMQQVLYKSKWLTATEILQITSPMLLDLEDRLRRAKLNKLEFYSASGTVVEHESIGSHYATHR